MRASEGQFGAADSTLGQFALRFPDSPQAIETAYWRALFTMDPANAHGSLQTATSFLDAYLAGPHGREHGPEAASLRRVASQLDSANKRAEIAVAQARDAAMARAQSGDVRIDV